MKRIATANRAVDLFAAGKDGFRQAVPGVSDATYLTALFFNHLQESIVRTIESAGLVLSDTDYDQFVTAIKKLQQTATESYAIDTGVANTYQAAYSPAVSVLADGMVLKFRAKTANTGASTFSPNGLAAAPIWGGDHAAISGGEIVANGDVWIQWNSALNGGNGAWLLIDSTGGFLKSPTPAQFDNSQKLATTEFAQRALGNLRTETAVNSSTTLSSAAIGQLIVGGTGTYTTTLPLANSVPAGSCISFFGSTGIVTWLVQRQGTDILDNNGGVTFFNLGVGDTAILESNGTGTWRLIGGSASLRKSADFRANFASSGYQRLPSGLIFQWLSGTFSSTGTNQVMTASFPIAFPNGLFTAIVGGWENALVTDSPVCLKDAGTNLTTLQVFCGNTTAGATAWKALAIGY